MTSWFSIGAFLRFPNNFTAKGTPANIITPFAIIMKNISGLVRLWKAELKKKVSICAIKEYTKKRLKINVTVSRGEFQWECFTIKVIARQIQATVINT